MIMGEVYKSLGKCDSCQGDVKCIRKACQLMEKYHGHGGNVKVLGEV